jgi:L-alanine-DL-glutamate epimerase-like enolase superfamily enzyme
VKTFVTNLQVSVYTIPTDKPESDGTLEWKATTMVLVTVWSGDFRGIGYTYADAAVGNLIGSVLREVVVGRDVMDVVAIQTAMVKKIRNNGQCGMAMMAVSAVDIALWDLKARILGLPLCRLLGMERVGIKIYGSGGFTSYSDEELREQVARWVEKGIRAVKIKVGRDIKADERRVGAVRDAIEAWTGLYVDANGAYTVNEAVAQAELFSRYGVDWLEEPVPAVEREQLILIRRQVGGAMRIVAGEYGYHLNDFRVLLQAGAVDVLQADATRCGGITGFLKAGHLCEAFRVPLSSHCAPAVHLHVGLALACFSIAEYFHDHVRIEEGVFDGVSMPRDGQLFPDLSQPGLGLVFKERAAEAYRVA